MQVNFLSNALLSLLLLPLLEKTSHRTKNPSDPSNGPTRRPPTVTWVGSIGQAFNSLAQDPIPSSESILTHMADAKKYSPLARYANTRLMGAMFVRELARHVLLPRPRPNENVDVDDDDNGHEIFHENIHDDENDPSRAILINIVCPGTVDTTADNDLPFWLRIPLNLHRRLRGRTVQEGARALVYAAVCAGKESMGGFIADNGIRE